MRIGVITTSYPRDADDFSGNFVAGHCEWMRNQGFDVEVVAAAPAGDHPVSVGASLFFRGGAPEALASPSALPKAITFQVAQWQKVRRRSKDWDAVIAHWLVPSGLSAALATGLPTTVVCHSGDVHLLRKWRLIESMAKLMVGRGVRLNFVSHELQERFCRAIGNSALRAKAVACSQVCAMGIDLHAFERHGARAANRRLRALFLGRLSPVKGVDVFAAAASRVVSDIEFIAAGPGAAALPPSVTRLGAVSPSERSRLLARADFVVIPSVILPDGRSEGTPLVALEAMASGAAVIASAVGGLKELAPALELVAPGDSAELAAKLDELAQEPERRQKLAKTGQARARTSDWSLVGPRLLPQEVLQRS